LNQSLPKTIVLNLVGLNPMARDVFNTIFGPDEFVNLHLVIPNQEPARHYESGTVPFELVPLATEPAEHPTPSRSKRAL
jgi:hypothetical protein